MEFYLKPIITGFLLILICCCFVRQRRYWRELNESRPSGSIRAGYRLAIFSVVVSLVVAVLFRGDTTWQIFIGILIMALVFCVKITFSPSIIALTLAVCTYQLNVNNEFPLLEVWSAIISVATWRLPEEVRVAYACVSFMWVMVTLLSSGPTEPVPGDTAVDGLADTITSLHT
jgi:hypothetical protein